MRKAYLHREVNGISLYALCELFNRLYAMLKFVITIHQNLTKVYTTFAFIMHNAVVLSSGIHGIFFRHAFRRQ